MVKAAVANSRVGEAQKTRDAAPRSLSRAERMGLASTTSLFGTALLAGAFEVFKDLLFRDPLLLQCLADGACESQL